jgi:hypothetical protein
MCKILIFRLSSDTCPDKQTHITASGLGGHGAKRRVDTQRSVCHKDRRKNSTKIIIRNKAQEKGLR